MVRHSLGRSESGLAGVYLAGGSCGRVAVCGAGGGSSALDVA